MPNILSNEEINDACRAIVRGTADGYRYHFNPVFSVLIATGLRIEEAIQRDRWTWYGGETYRIDTEKDSNDRLINFQDYGITMYQYWLYDWKVYAPFSARSYQKVCEQYNGWERITVGEKNVQTHLFRHNIARQLYEGGATIQDVADFLGLISVANAEGYIFSEVVGL